MSKKGKTLLCLFLLVAAVCLLFPKSRTIYGISDGGVYSVAAESEGSMEPWIWFDMSGKSIRFTSALDAGISLTTSGTVEFHNEKVYAVSDDGMQTWIFEVKDNDTLLFVAKGSTIPTDSKGNAAISDGAQFKRIA